MFSSFQQRFPMQDLRQWVPLLDMFPLDPEVDTGMLLETFLPGSVYKLYQKGDMFPRPFWAIPSKKVFQTLPVPTSLPIESISLPKLVVSPPDPELPIPTPQVTVATEAPVRVQTPPPEIPTIRKKISTPSFTRPSTPSRPGTPTCSNTPSRPSTPVDVRSSLPHPPKSSLSNTLSGSFSTLKKSPSVRDFLGTAANFAKESKPKQTVEKTQDVASTPLVPVSVPSERSTPQNGLGDCSFVAQEKEMQEKQKQMALVQYYSPVIQLPLPGSIQYGTPDAHNASRKESSYTSPKESSQRFPGLGSYVKPPKETPEIPIDPQHRALVTHYLKKLQTKAAKVQSQFSPAPPTSSSSVTQQSSLVRFNRAFSSYRATLDNQSDSTPEMHIDLRYKNYVHHFVKKSVFKTAAAGSSRSIMEVMQELRKDSIFLKTIAPGAILQALDDAVVARLRQSLAAQSGNNNSITRFCDASARMDDLRRFLGSLTKDNGQCVEFEHWVEEVPVDSEQTLPIDFTVDFADGTPAIRGTLSGPNALKDSVRRRMKTFRPRSSRESEFAFNTSATVNDTPLKRTLGNKNSSVELRLYKRSRNGSSDDVSIQRPKSMFSKSRNVSSENVSSIQRPKHLSIITTPNEKLRAISNSSIRELILSPINTSTTQIDGQIAETIFVELVPDSPSSTTGSMEQWEQSSTLSRFSMGSAQTGLTVPYPCPSLSPVSERTPRKQTPEEEWGATTTQATESLRSKSPCRESISESQKEDDARSSPAPAFNVNHFLKPRKCRSISEITLDNPKEYRAERLKRSYSSTSSLSKFSSVARLPTVLSPTEPQITISDETSTRDSSESLDMVTKIEELENPLLVLPAPVLPAEARRTDSGFPSGDERKSAHGLLKEIAAVGEDVKRVTQGSRKTTITKDVKIITTRDTEDEVKPIEERGAKKTKFFGRFKDRVKGLKKKVSGAMKGGKEI